MTSHVLLGVSGPQYNVRLKYSARDLRLSSDDEHEDLEIIIRQSTQLHSLLPIIVSRRVIGITRSRRDLGGGVFPVFKGENLDKDGSQET